MLGSDPTERARQTVPKVKVTELSVGSYAAAGHPQTGDCTGFGAKRDVFRACIVLYLLQRYFALNRVKKVQNILGARDLTKVGGFPND